MEHEKLQKAESQAKQQELNLTGIPTQMKWDLEARSGLSLDDVRVHYHSDKPAKLGALAYTQGTQVHIGPGQEGHLRHELGHVVQQKLGLVRPNAWYPGGLALNTEEALERQADVIGTGSYCQPLLSAGMPPVQRFEDPVVQAQGHIILEASQNSQKEEEKEKKEKKEGKEGEDNPETQAATKTISLPDTSLPTIVFEAMGDKVEDCEEVYKQTKLYSGNTICVFGLNAETGNETTFQDKMKALGNYQKKVDDDNDTVQQGTVQQGTDQQGTDQQGADQQGAAKQDAVKQDAVKQDAVKQDAVKQNAVKHLLYTFSFQWTSPSDKKDGYYRMPFVEARILVMQKAAEFVGKLQKPDGNPVPNQYKFLYRWIDADARDDETKSLGYGQLSKLADESEAAVMTGRYDWRSMVTEDNKIPKYKEFIKEFNQAEQELREHYYELSGETSGDDKRPELAEISSHDYLPGYYYPEPTLMMNQIAHNKIAGLYPVGGNPDDVLKRIGAANKEQDKESMRLLGLPGFSPQIDFNPELSVTKPLKDEFVKGSYWGKDMLAFLREPQDQADFIVALKNVRQSAFDPGRWYFIREDPWNKWEVPNSNIKDILKEKQERFNLKRRELVEKLFQFLDSKDGRGETNKQKIAREIASVSGGQEKTNNKPAEEIASGSGGQEKTNKKPTGKIASGSGGQGKTNQQNTAKRKPSKQNTAKRKPSKQNTATGKTPVGPRRKKK